MHSINCARVNCAIVVLAAISLLGGCATTPEIDTVDWDTVLQKAELSLRMAHEVYALWELTHELLGTPEEELLPKREAFRARIAELEKYLEWVKEMK